MELTKASYRVAFIPGRDYGRGVSQSGPAQSFSLHEGLSEAPETGASQGFDFSSGMFETEATSPQTFGLQEGLASGEMYQPMLDPSDYIKAEEWDPQGVWPPEGVRPLDHISGSGGGFGELTEPEVQFYDKFFEEDLRRAIKGDSVAPPTAETFAVAPLVDWQKMQNRWGEVRAEQGKAYDVYLKLHEERIAPLLEQAEAGEQPQQSQPVPVDPQTQAWMNFAQQVFSQRVQKGDLIQIEGGQEGHVVGFSHPEGGPLSPHPDFPYIIPLLVGSQGNYVWATGQFSKMVGGGALSTREPVYASKRTSKYMEGEPEDLNDVSIIVVVIQDEEGRILLVKRSPGEETRPGEWEVPGGHRDDGESIHEAGKREVLEEVGLEVKVKPGRQYFTLSDGGYGVMLRGVPVEGDIDLKVDEHDEYQWVQIKELKKERFQPQPPDFIKEVKSLVSRKKFAHEWMLVTGSDKRSHEIARRVRKAGHQVLSIAGGSINVRGPRSKAEVNEITGLPSRQIYHHGREFQAMSHRASKKSHSKKRAFSNDPSQGLRVADHQPPAMREAPEKVLEDTQAIFQQVEMPSWGSLWGLSNLEHPDYDAAVSPCSEDVQGPTSMDDVTGTKSGNAAYRIITDVLREEIEGGSEDCGCGCSDDGDGKTATVTLTHPRQVRKVARKLKRYGFQVFKTRIPTQLRARLAADELDPTSFSINVQEDDPADVIEKEVSAEVNQLGGGEIELTAPTPGDAADAMEGISELSGKEILLDDSSSSMIGSRRRRKNHAWY